MKKFIIWSLSILVFFISSYFLLSYMLTPKYNYKICPFCDEKVISAQKYYEDDYVFGLYNYRPLTEGHCLILSKRHVERFDDLTEDEEKAICACIKKTNNASKKILNTGDYIILQKNGKSVGQSVGHVHFHFIPRKIDQKNVLNFFFRFVITPFKPVIDKQELNRYVSAFSENI